MLSLMIISLLNKINRLQGIAKHTNSLIRRLKNVVCRLSMPVRAHFALKGEVVGSVAPSVRGGALRARGCGPHSHACGHVGLGDARVHEFARLKWRFVALALQCCRVVLETVWLRWVHYLAVRVITHVHFVSVWSMNWLKWSTHVSLATCRQLITTQQLIVFFAWIDSFRLLRLVLRHCTIFLLNIKVLLIIDA